MCGSRRKPAPAPRPAPPPPPPAKAAPKTPAPEPKKYGASAGAYDGAQKLDSEGTTDGDLVAQKRAGKRSLKIVKRKGSAIGTSSGAGTGLNIPN